MGEGEQDLVSVAGLSRRVADPKPQLAGVKEEGKGTKRKHQHQKNRSHTFKGASRKPQLKDCKLKQDASTKQKKKTRHEIDLRGFSHEAAVWKVLRRKENASKLKRKKNKLKQNHQSKEEEAT